MPKTKNTLAMTSRPDGPSLCWARGINGPGSFRAVFISVSYWHTIPLHVIAPVRHFASRSFDATAVARKFAALVRPRRADRDHQGECACCEHHGGHHPIIASQV